MKPYLRHSAPAATALTAMLALTACAHSSITAASPQAAFWSALQETCGSAYQGTVTRYNQTDTEWRTSTLTMHTHSCTGEAITAALHMGDDRSRTWILTRRGDAIEFRHDHRKPDGSADAITQYGGFSTDGGGALVQYFPADDATKALFDREGIPQSKPNVWSFDLSADGATLGYQLTRPGREFRIEFDLTTPVAAPPVAWGWTY